MRRLTVSLLCVTAAALLAGPVPAASAAQTWAPASSAAIHPGVQLFTNGAQCTANFIFTDGVHVFVGQAAHCSGTGGNTASDGCTSPSLPVGTPVTIPGATRPGTIVYNSWLTMQALHETNPDVCQYNDLALVQLDPADSRSVNPSIPIWGGPTGLTTAGTALGDPVYGYGHSELAMGLSVLSPKQGVSVGDSGSGWSHGVLTLSPGIPGDSGRAYLDFHTGEGFASLGHNHPDGAEVLHATLRAELVDGVQIHYSPLAGMLAEELSGLLPDGLDAVFFPSSGSEAVRFTEYVPPDRFAAALARVQ